MMFLVSNEVTVSCREYSQRRSRWRGSRELMVQISAAGLYAIPSSTKEENGDEKGYE